VLFCFCCCEYCSKWRQQCGILDVDYGQHGVNMQNWALQKFSGFCLKLPKFLWYFATTLYVRKTPSFWKNLCAWALRTCNKRHFHLKEKVVNVSESNMVAAELIEWLNSVRADFTGQITKLSDNVKEFQRNKSKRLLKIEMNVNECLKSTKSILWRPSNKKWKQIHTYIHHLYFTLDLQE